MPLVDFYNKLRIYTILPLIGFLFSMVFYACQEDRGICMSDPDCLRLRFSYYQNMADSLRKLNSSATSIIDSKIYLDSASFIAQGLEDSTLIAINYLSLGRMYHEWEIQPDRAISYLKIASDLLADNKQFEKYYLESKLLLCEAYCQVGDSLYSFTTLDELLDKVPNSSLDMASVIEISLGMSMAALDLNKPDLANEILGNVEREIGKYPDLPFPERRKYYLLRAEVGTYFKGNVTNWIDSLDKLYANTDNLTDSLFYAEKLASLTDKSGDYGKAYKYQTILSSLLLRENAEVTKISKQKIEFAERSLIHTRNIEKKTDQLWVIIVCWLVLFAIAASYVIIFLRRGSNKYFNLSKELEFANNSAAVLYKELHHRIKNNLHLIFSLLQMQERQVGDLVTKQNLKDARLRIESIAIMHEEMINFDDRIDFKDFIHRLIQLIISCFSLNTQIISEINFYNVEIPRKYNFPVSLIINEWISNSIKHAFSEGRLLEVTLNVYSEDDKIVIEYYDNGSERSDSQTSTGLGTKIVELLMKQMKAELLKGHKGLYHYKIKFNKI